MYLSSEWLHSPSGMITVSALVVLLAITISLIIKVYRNKPRTPYDKLIGCVGQVLTPITPQKDGQISVFGEVWVATAAESIKEDTDVEVLAVESHPVARVRVARYLPPETRE